MQQLASRISLRAQDYRAAGQDLPDAAIAAPDYQLAVLHALHTAQRAGHDDHLAERQGGWTKGSKIMRGYREENALIGVL
ncbi:hypothetical protein [Streptomyces sp. NPDC059909]|uniref:hypothetical protein n=1 Tax=Streptomyces sp. NPDC059909 TaxID=3346998 RepID=UPI00364CA928